MTPSKETIDAALRLAEAASEICGGITPDTDQAKEFVSAVFAYRCATSKLRTRAEVDAEAREAVAVALESLMNLTSTYGNIKIERAIKLLREPTRDDSGPGDGNAECGCPDPGTVLPPRVSLSDRIARLERATEMAPYAERIRAQREIRDELERR